jgi:hypothetical protein
MPSEDYRIGFKDGVDYAQGKPSFGAQTKRVSSIAKPKRKLSAWNKFVKANSKKKIYQFASGKLKLKKMGIAFRKKKR